MKKRRTKSAIVLLITVFFIMLISVSVGVGLKYVNETSTSVGKTEFIYQSSIALDDVLDILKTSKELELIDSPEALDAFLSLFIPPFLTNGISVTIDISSARSKLHPNILKKVKTHKAFSDFLLANNISESFINVLRDSIGGNQADGSYNTDIFINNPLLFRDYITSYEHFDEIKEIYKKQEFDNSVETVKFDDVFYFKDTNATGASNYKVDFNQVSSLALEVMLGCSPERALFLSENSIPVKTLEELDITPEELLRLKRFELSPMEKFIEVKVKVTQKDMQANIQFEYNIATKKGSNFVFKI